MKNVITLTKTLTLAALILVFAGASAANIKTDDTTKCKKSCCKHKQIQKEVNEATAEVNESMKDFNIVIKAFSSATVNAELEKAFALAPLKVISQGDRFIFISNVEPVKSTVEAQQKIDFSNLNKEIDKVQENMSQMDPALKKEDEKTRKAAEELLQTGIKS
jgi:hypothetical protein